MKYYEPVNGIFTYKTLEFPFPIPVIAQAVEAARIKFNEFLDEQYASFKKLGLSNDVRNQFLSKGLGDILEPLIREELNKIIDAYHLGQYVKGNERKEPDLLYIDNNGCKRLPLSIEVKTKKTCWAKNPELRCPSMTGSKSYAVDKNSEKDKNGFYISVVYKPLDNNNGDYKFKDYDVWFGWIKQSDWCAAKNGNSCNINKREVLEHKIYERMCLVHTTSPCKYGKLYGKGIYAE